MSIFIFLYSEWSGPRSTQDSVRRTERGRASLRPTLAANFTRRRPLSDASLDLKQAVTSPVVHSECHVMSRTKNEECKEQTTGSVGSRDRVADSSRTSRELVTARVLSDGARSPDDSVERPQRRNIRGRLSAFVRRHWSKFRQTVEVLNCAANSQTSC